MICELEEEGLSGRPRLHEAFDCHPFWRREVEEEML